MDCWREIIVAYEQGPTIPVAVQDQARRFNSCIARDHRDVGDLSRDEFLCFRAIGRMKASRTRSAASSEPMARISTSERIMRSASSAGAGFFRAASAPPPLPDLMQASSSRSSAWAKVKRTGYPALRVCCRFPFTVAHAVIGSVVRTAQASYLMYAKRWSFCGVPSSAPPAFPGCH